MVDPFSFQKGLKLTVEELGPRICLQPLRLTAQGLTDVSKGPNQAIPGLVLQGHDPSVLGQHVNDRDQVPIPISLTPTKLHVDQVRLPLVVNILDKNSARPEPTHHRPVARCKSTATSTSGASSPAQCLASGPRTPVWRTPHIRPPNQDRNRVLKACHFPRRFSSPPSVVSAACSLMVIVPPQHAI